MARKLLFWTNRCLILPTTITTQNELYYFKKCLISYEEIKDEITSQAPDTAKESQFIKARLVSEVVGCAAYMKLLSFYSPAGKSFIRLWFGDFKDDLQQFVDKCVFNGVN